MQIEKTNEKLIELKELQKILPIKTIVGIVKWCEKAGINIEIVGGKRVVHRFLVDMELDKGLISQLREKHPKKWEALYNCYKEGDHLGFLLLLEDTSELKKISRPKNRFKKSNRIQNPKSDMAKKFADL